MNRWVRSCHVTLPFALAATLGAQAIQGCPSEGDEVPDGFEAALYCGRDGQTKRTAVWKRGQEIDARYGDGMNWLCEIGREPTFSEATVLALIFRIQEAFDKGVYSTMLPIGAEYSQTRWVITVTDIGWGQLDDDPNYPVIRRWQRIGGDVVEAVSGYGLAGVGILATGDSGPSPVVCPKWAMP